MSSLPPVFGLERISRPIRTRGSLDPPPLDIVARVNTVKLRFRKAIGGQAVVTGDCIANLLGYQTTSAVVNRLAETISVKKIEMWANFGVAGDSVAANTVTGEVRLLFETGNTSAGLAPIFPTTFSDIGSPSRPAHISAAPPQALMIPCGQTNRWVFCRIDGPLGTIVDITLEWAFRRPDIASVYTLTSATVTVGLAPYCAYLDNTTVGGAPGAASLYRVSASGQDFSAYG